MAHRLGITDIESALRKHAVMTKTQAGTGQTTPVSWSKRH